MDTTKQNKCYSNSFLPSKRYLQLLTVEITGQYVKQVSSVSQKNLQQTSEEDMISQHQSLQLAKA